MPNTTYSVIGISHRSGEFNGRPYSHYSVHMTYELSGDRAIGSGTFVCNIKDRDFDPDIRVGDLVIPRFNRYGRCDFIEKVS